MREGAGIDQAVAGARIAVQANGGRPPGGAVVPVPSMDAHVARLAHCGGAACVLASRPHVDPRFP